MIYLLRVAQGSHFPTKDEQISILYHIVVLYYKVLFWDLAPLGILELVSQRIWKQAMQ